MEIFSWKNRIECNYTIDTSYFDLLDKQVSNAFGVKTNSRLRYYSIFELFFFSTFKRENDRSRKVKHGKVKICSKTFP